MKTQIINQIIKDRGYKSYLEIGYGNGSNFKNIEVENKIAVDPNVTTMLGFKDPRLEPITSDEFFLSNEDKFDLIFIDGLHHSDQVERDIVNSWKALNSGGMILIHDILPKNEEMTLVPRKTKQWTGNVFKAWHGFVTKYPKIKISIDYREEWGLGIIEKSRHRVSLGFVSDISFDDYLLWLKD